MRKLPNILVLFLASFNVLAASNSNPGLYYGQVPTAAQWNSYFSSKLDYSPGAANNLPYWDGSGNLLAAPVSGSCTFAGGTFDCSTTNLAGGTVGAIPYQSAPGATLFLSGNTTITPQFVTSTGTGAAAQAPILTGSMGTGKVVLQSTVALMPTVASATAPDIFGAAGATINYTGTTTATSFVAATADQIGSIKQIITASDVSFTASANLIIDGLTSGTILQPAGAILQVTPLSTTAFKMTTVSAYGSWTPIVTANIGTFTTVSATGTYVKVGRKISISGRITITDNGTAASAILISIPFLSGVDAVLAGTEIAATGNTSAGRISPGSGIAIFANYNNAYPGGTGYVIIFSGSYFI